METMLRSQERESLVELARDVASGAKDLLTAHGAQARAEIREEATRAETAFYELGFGSSLLFIGTAFLLVAGVMVLQERTGWSPSVSWAVVGLGTLLVGLTAVVVARAQLHKVHILPDQTLHSLQESLSWITKR